LAAVVFLSPGYYLLGIGIVGTVCLVEYFELAGSMGFGSRPWVGYISLWALLAAFRLSRFPTTIVIALVLMMLFLSAMCRRCPVRERVVDLMAELMGVFYVTLFLYPALPLRFDFGELVGLHWTLILISVIWSGDVVALMVGKQFGRNSLAAHLSPNKTLEGAVGGLVAGVCAAALLQHLFFTDLPLRHVVAASILLGIFGQLGDLAESMLKRAAQVKDSSGIIPGHGGALDRMDSMLFAFPVLYLYLLQLYT